MRKRGQVNGKVGPRNLQVEDVLIVAPYNAQVAELAERLPKGMRIGTVEGARWTRSWLRDLQVKLEAHRSLPVMNLPYSGRGTSIVDAFFECVGLITVGYGAGSCGTQMDFVALDVETASANIGSICQLGIAHFSQGKLSRIECHLVDPQTRFAASHIALHGIEPSTVAHSPVWEDLYVSVRPSLLGKVIVSHTLYDRKSIFQACCRCRSPMFSYVRWVDSCETARKAWPELDGHSLGFLARHFGLPHRAHDAGEDARLAGQIYLLASGQIARRAELGGSPRPDDNLPPIR